MNTLLTVGSVAFDSIETIFAKSGKILGGAGTYISIAASIFNIRNNLISIVGGDFPEKYIDIFRSRGIDLAGLIRKEDKKTFYWEGKYEKNMNIRHTLRTELNVLAEFDPVLPQEYRTPTVLMLGNLSPDVQYKVISQLAVRPKLIVLDTMDYWIQNSRERLLEVIAQIDVITINEEEARLLTDEYFLLKAARKIFTYGPKFVIIKKGDNGAALYARGDQMFFMPAYPLEEVYDPTGAGDTFAGSFCGYLAQTNDFSFENMKNAVVIASAVASFNVEKFGTQRLLSLTENEIKERIQDFVAYTGFKFPKDLKLKIK